MEQKLRFEILENVIYLIQRKKRIVLITVLKDSICLSCGEVEVEWGGGGYRAEIYLTCTVYRC